MKHKNRPGNPVFLKTAAGPIVWLMIMIALPVLFGCAGTKKNHSSPANQHVRKPSAAPNPASRNKEIVTHVKSSKYRSLKTTQISRHKAICKGTPIDFARLIRQIALKLQAQRLYYNSKKLTDCSGIFHRVIGEMRKICPNYDSPSPTRQRSSRDIARWFLKRGELIPVNDPIRMANLIKPGAVMFFAHGGKDLDKFAGKPSFNVNIVSHIGIVVAVEKDPAGRVISYQLFHGRSRGKFASVTQYHYRNPPKKYLPPFGNHTQPWVAVARLVGP